MTSKKKPLPPFAVALKDARMHHRMQQPDLAYELGVSLRSLSRWESGHVIPTGLAPRVVEWARGMPREVGEPLLVALGILVPQPPRPPAPPAPSAEEVTKRIEDAIRVAAERLDVGARSFRVALDGVFAAMVATGASVGTVRQIAAAGVREPSPPKDS